MSLISSTVTAVTWRFNPTQSFAHSPSWRGLGKGVKCSNSWAEIRMWHPLWNLGGTGEGERQNLFQWWKQRHPGRSRNQTPQMITGNALYRCKIFLFVNADLLNLFPQIPKPITLCILQKILFFVLFLYFFLPTLDTIIQNRKNCRTNTGRMLEYCTREEKYSRNNLIQLFIKRKIYTIDLFCKIKIHHAIYITSSELYYWIYQQFTVHFNCAHKKKLHFFFLYLACEVSVPEF